MNESLLFRQLDPGNPQGNLRLNLTQVDCSAKFSSSRYESSWCEDLQESRAI